MSRVAYAVSHHPLQRKFAGFVAQAEKAKESLAALTAAQKALMNSAFKEKA